MKHSIETVVTLSLILVYSVVAYAEETGGGAAEMARKLQDPLANISALMTDNDIQFKTGDDDTSYSFQLQPVYALDFPDRGFTFIPRAIIPIIGAAPESTFPKLGDPRPEGDSTTWGLSDILTQFFFAPKTEAKWKWGIGPQISWETRTDDKVGGPGWGAGLAGVLVGNLTEQLSFAGFLNQHWSFDGEYSTMGFQPNLYYNFKALEGAFVAYNASITANWKADSSNTWVIPLGIYAGKMFDLSNGYGVELGIGPYWNVVKPDGAADWFLKFQVNFIFPK
jgi:hypothetical protein